MTFVPSDAASPPKRLRGLAAALLVGVAIAALIGCGGSSPPPPPELTLLAGTLDAGGAGFADGVGDAARFDRPESVAIDAQGRIVVGDTSNFAIRRIDGNGRVTTLVADTRIGVGNERFDLLGPVAVAADGEVLFVAYRPNVGDSAVPNPRWVVRSVAADGRVRTKIDPHAPGSGADPTWLVAGAIAAAADGRVFISDGVGCAIRVWEPASGLRTFAVANEKPDGQPCVGVETLRFGPGPIAVDKAGNVYYSINESIVRIAANGERSRRPAPLLMVLSTIAADDDGNIYAPSTNRVMRIAPDGVVSNVAGSTTSGVDDGAAGQARFASPRAVARAADGRLYVADWLNHSIREIDTAGLVRTVAGRPEQSVWRDGVGAQARFGADVRLAPAADGGVYFSDGRHSVVRRVTADGVVRTVAGQPDSYGNGNGPAGISRLSSPGSLLVESDGSLLVSEALWLRRVKTDGSIEAAGSPPASSGLIDAIAAAPDGSLLMATSNTQFSANGGIELSWFDIFRRDSKGGDINVLSSQRPGLPPPEGIEGLRGVAASRSGRIFFTYGHAVWELTSGQQVAVVAGAARSVGSTDGIGSGARFNNPQGLAIDERGRLYVADSGNHTVRRIDSDGKVSTLVGVAGMAGLKTGALPAGLDAPHDVAVTSRGLVIASQLALMRLPLVD